MPRVTPLRAERPAALARGPVWVDFVVAALVAAAAVTVLVRLGVPDRIVAWWDGGPGVAVDLAVAGLLVVPVVLTAVALRRWHVAGRLADDVSDLAGRDPVTGLPGRHVVVNQLAHLGGSGGPGSVPAVVVVLLGHLESLQQRLGWAMGDEVLAAVARRVVAEVRVGDLVGRIGVAELAVVCPVGSAAEVSTVANRVARALGEPLDVGGGKVRVEASVGAAGGRQAAVDPVAVLTAAAEAARTAREGGGDRVAIVASGSVLAGRRADERRLAQAFEQDEFRLYYQPVVDASDGRVVAVEALIRWEHPQEGFIPPGAFIPKLEASGLIVPVGAWVLREACRAVADLNARLTGPPIRVAVNVSPPQVVDTDLRATVVDALRTSGLPADQLTIEITEGALVADPAHAWQRLRDVRALGVKLALDDFGTGWSSLSFVRRFVIDLLKIDRSFVNGLEVSAEDRAIVGAVLGIAQAIGIPCVAEGVETAGQVRALQALGCPLLQGFYFSKPAPLEEALGLVERAPV